MKTGHSIQFLSYSSMFFDADEDLAHEFYEEAKIRLPNGHVKLSMKRIRHNLQPQVYSSNLKIHMCLYNHVYFIRLLLFFNATVLVSPYA